MQSEGNKHVWHSQNLNIFRFCQSSISNTYSNFLSNPYLRKSALVTCQNSFLLPKHGDQLLLCSPFNPRWCNSRARCTLLNIWFCIWSSSKWTWTGWRKWTLPFNRSLGCFSITHAILWRRFAWSACALGWGGFTRLWLFSIPWIWLIGLQKKGKSTCT